MKARHIQVANRAEREIMKHSEDTVLWHRHVTGQQADAHQALWIYEIEESPNTVMVEPPRAGKTWSMEAVDMRELFCFPRETCLIVGPKQDQANNALREMTDWIEGSELLKAYIAFKRGKRQISESKFELMNGSRAKTFGIYSQIDSEDASIIRGEEFDDIDRDRWTDRVMTRAGRKNRSGKPSRYRLSGTIQKDKGNLFDVINSGVYKIITQLDIYALMEIGIYDQNAIDLIRAEMTDEEWLRVYMLVFTEARNFIWESYLQQCREEGLRLNWDGVEYQPGGEYRPRGVVYCGFDCGHSGRKKQRSVYRMDVVEYIGSRALWLNGFEWDPTEDPEVIKREFVDIWRFYDISAGYGDALKANWIADVNDDLFSRGLIRTDRSKFPKNEPSSWDKWEFAPKWNTGKFKYLSGGETKKLIENRKLILPYHSRKDDRPIANMARRLYRAILNVRQVTNNSAYPTLECIKAEIGDDPFDSINMATACANDRMIINVNLGDVRSSGPSTRTAGLRTSVLEDLQDVGRGADFDSF